MTDRMKIIRNVLNELVRHGADAGAGDEVRFRCPLPDHADTTASADFNKVKGVWICRSCGGGGTAEDLARLLGIGPTQTDPTPDAEAEQLDVFAALAAYAKHCHDRLPPDVREEYFIKTYGFNDQTISEHLLGYDDGGAFSYLTEHLGLDRELVLASGAFHVKADGTVVDRYPGRLIFPYFENGEVVYLTARKTRHTSDAPWEEPKYKKLSTRSEKRPYISEVIRNDTLFAEDVAGGSIETLVITEGVPDCIAANQAGVPCISPGTTTPRAADYPKLLAITKNVRRIVICNDAETSGAGEEGALATAAVLYAQGRDVRIAALPRPEGVEKIDIADFCRDNPPEEFVAVIDRAKDFIEFALDKIPVGAVGPELESLLTPLLAPVVGRSQIEKDRVVELVHERLGLRVGAVRDFLKNVPPLRIQIADLPMSDGKPPSDKPMRGEVIADVDHYKTIIGFDDHGIPIYEKISSFVLRPVEIVVVGRDEHVIADVVTDSGRVHNGHRFAPSAWTSKRDFCHVLTNINTQFVGTDNNIQGIKRLIAQHEVPLRRGVNVVGMHDLPQGRRWIAPGIVLGPDGIEENSDIVFIDDGSTFASRLRYTLPPPEDVRQLAQAVYPDLVAMNEQAVTLLLIGWIHAAPMRILIMSVLGGFPSLHFGGTSGAGKTSTMRRVFWLLCGIPDMASATPYSATMTRFALIRLLASTNGAPVFLDEYRPSDMDPKQVELIHRVLRQLYSGEAEERGRADQGVNRYDLLAPAVVAGESRPEDAALADRMISVSPDKNALQNPVHLDAFNRLTGFKLSDLAAPYLVFLLQQNLEERLKDAIAAADAIIARLPNGDNLSARCRNNLRAVHFGLSMWQAFATTLGVSLPELDVESAFAATTADLMTGTRGAKNQLDTFLEDLAVLAHDGKIALDQDFAVIDDELRLRLRPCWVKFLEHRQRTGQRDATNGLTALQRLIRENQAADGYVRNPSKPTPMNGGNPRTVAISLSTAGEILDLDGFLAFTPRLWGGVRAVDGRGK